MTDIETFDIPAFTSQGGISLDLQLAYKTYGDMSAAKDNVILVLRRPTRRSTKTPRGCSLRANAWTSRTTAWSS